MLKFIFLIFTIPSLCVAFDTSTAPSAVRDPQQSWRQILNQEKLKQLLKFDIMTPPEHVYVTAAAVPYAHVDITSIPEFGKSDDEIQVLFESIRNLRFLEDPEVSNFKRRITWLYPQDGCFARAEHVARLIKKQYPEATFQRVFVFGDLEAKTVNAPFGSVTWWYHVAVILKHDNKTFVMDPSLDLSKPLQLTEWVKLMVKDPAETEVALCAEAAYSPTSFCDNVTYLSDIRAEQEIRGYEKSERFNLKRLKRDPEAELGNNPPW